MMIAWADIPLQTNIGLAYGKGKDKERILVIGADF